MIQSITAEQLEQHKQWRFNQSGGVRLDLRSAYLRGADLCGADLNGAYLRGAYLRGADLRGADLCGADLNGAYLRGAYLNGADLLSADLRSADLRGADLRNADLRSADLSSAELSDAVGNMREVKSAQFDTYRICWWHPPDGGQILQIGCQRHTLDKWQAADAQWIANMAHNAAKWWAKYGAIVLQLVEASPAVPYGRPKDEP